ncbi:MAG: amidohydrolase family protein [Firmicutes bacterium]|nr:amidohydrolase family protein [Bacillota bacterium]
MIYDAHIHLNTMEKADAADTLARMESAGIGGGAVFSYKPNVDIYDGNYFTPGQKLDALMEFTAGHGNLFPFYRIDPTEKDAADQVALAVSYGVRGFKVICHNHYPGDERAMKTYRAVARAGKPMLFHSGILYDSLNSSNYNRPAGFEALFEVEGLRFAMAHVSWPWCDEMIALFGKYKFAGRKNKDIELFVDLTPGTPDIYREEVLTKLIRLSAFGFTDHMMFGTDNVENYDDGYAKSIIDMDGAIYDKLGVPAAEREKIYSGNLLRFLGI